MSDSPAVFRLIYRSHCLITPEDRREGLGEIFTTARRKNKSLGITGALVVAHDSFVQALEGEETVVRELYATIAQDPRHRDVALIEEEVVGERTFGRWAMARVTDDGAPDIRLSSNASKGVIVDVPGRDLTITPEQERVLSGMREVANAQHAGR